ncbi:DUF3786 domain-containing protein [Bacillota bacterium LX-D]|nr:DUF3786 domain-containing protein [Bacillota bacterium LX-D]
MEYPGNYLPAWQETVAKFATEQNPQSMAKLSGAQYDENKKVFQLKFFNELYEIAFPSGEITAKDSQRELGLGDKTLLLQYLLGACALERPQGWLSFKDLPAGVHHYNPFVLEAIVPLVRYFGTDEERVQKACLALNAEEIEGRNKFFIVKALPKVILGLAHWPGSTNEQSMFNILFDRSAILHLDTVALYMLGISFSYKLLSAV